MVGNVQRAEVHHPAKFCQNRSNSSRDITVFQFCKMTASHHLDFQIPLILTADDPGVSAFLASY